MGEGGTPILANKPRSTMSKLSHFSFWRLDSRTRSRPRASGTNRPLCGGNLETFGRKVRVVAPSQSRAQRGHSGFELQALGGDTRVSMTVRLHSRIASRQRATLRHGRAQARIGARTASTCALVRCCSIGDGKGARPMSVASTLAWRDSTPAIAAPASSTSALRINGT